MTERKKIRIGEALVLRSGETKVTQKQVEEVLAYQKNNNHMRFGEILISKGYMQEEDFFRFLAEFLGYDFVNLREYPVDINIVPLLRRSVATQYTILPIEKNGETIVIACNDPLNYRAMTDVRSFIDANIKLVICLKDDIVSAIERYHREIEMGKSKDILAVNNEEQKIESDLDVGNMGSSDARFVTFVHNLLMKGYSINASDIHIEPFERQTIIRMRLDGKITEYMQFKVSADGAEHNSLIARIKILSSLDIAEKRLPQDGHFSYKSGDKSFNIRTSVIPTVFGEKAVLRFLNINSRLDDEGQFGMKVENYNTTMKILSNPHGIIYITGATGSGKTTTLYLILQHLASKDVSIATIEDPVEKNIPKVSQMQVNLPAGLTFQRGLRAILRQDPDIIMIGETRDEETASISVKSAITGHLVLSTIHTNDSVSTISRLTDMGIPPYMIASSVVGIISQRLVRKLCVRCKESYEPTDAEKRDLGVEVERLHRGYGCAYCNHTGYNGRIAVHEIMEVDNNIRRMISEKKDAQIIREYCVKEKNVKLLIEQTRALVLDGTTTISEFMSVASLT